MSLFYQPKQLLISEHVSNVYQLVLYGLASFSVGGYIGFNVFNTYIAICCQVLTFVGLFGVILSSNAITRFCSYLLMASALGYSGGYFFQESYAINQNNILFACLLTMSLFGVFTLVSKFLYDELAQVLGIFCIGSLYVLLIVPFFLLFVPYNVTLNTGYLMFGLVTFCGFVSYDTYEMHRRFREGKYDYYIHATNLFLDIINLFTKILRLLNKNEKK